MTNKSEEGNQFCKGFGGIAGILRFRHAFELEDEDDVAEVVDADDDDFKQEEQQHEHVGRTSQSLTPIEEDEADEKDAPSTAHGMDLQKSHGSSVQAGLMDEEVVTNQAEASQMKAPDARPHLNVVFIGHVDAGKSTTCGNILFLSGCVDERTIARYKREAKEKNRENWYLAYIMDTNEEEQDKGKTVEVGRAHFETEHKRFTVLDAPGHKAYVPNMIAGASQADVGVLIISARKGEFETGFDKGGQTREHAMLARTLGVENLIVAINKMDDQSVQWEQDRYNDIVKRLRAFIKPPLFKQDQVVFLPISGLTGDNIKERNKTPAWYTGPTLLSALDDMSVSGRKTEGPFRVPMLDGFRDNGAVMAIGKVEQGIVKPGTKCIVQPIGRTCSIASVFIDEEEVQCAEVGESIGIKMQGCSEDDLKKGYVLSPIVEPVRAVTKFTAQIHVLELPEEIPVIAAGYRTVIHVHVAIEECEISKLVEAKDTKVGIKDRVPQKNPAFVREGMVAEVSIQMARSVAVDCFTESKQLGRFTLRKEGVTIAMGRIIKLAETM